MSLYVFSKEAENDLVEIYRYGFINYGESKVDLYIEVLKEKCQFLADMPNLCPDRDEFNPPVKIHHHRKHLIISKIATKSEARGNRILFKTSNQS